MPRRIDSFYPMLFLVLFVLLLCLKGTVGPLRAWSAEAGNTPGKVTPFFPPAATRLQYLFAHN